jgi:hypothetical protein
MANVYGSRNLNQFPLPSVDSTQTYYTLVNTETGEITLKRFNRSQIIDSALADEFDATVGTIPATGPNKGKFIPNDAFLGINGITENEKKAFAQQPQALQQVKDKARETSNNAQRDLNVDLQTRQKRTNELLQNGRVDTPPSGDQPDGGTGATAGGVEQGLTNLTNTQIAGSKKTRLVTQYPDKSLLRYPIDMDKTQDYIQFTMLEYRPRKLSPKLLGEGKVLEDRLEAKTRGSTVVLPIQPSISDTNTVKWGEDTMNAFEGIAAAVALGSIKDGVVGATESITGIEKLFASSSAMESLKNAAAAYFAGQAAQVKGLVPRVLGGIINPNIELLFEGPQLRTFQFNFTLSAREPNESKNIRNIIRFFKQGMSVKRAETDLFLKAPHTFEIKYIYGITQKDHPWINRIKECALTGCTVNYTPAGSYATFGDGAMTSYEIGLQFAELEAIYDDDYKLLDENTNDPNNIVIGY